MNAIILDLSPVIQLTDEQFFKLAIAHRDLLMERKRSGELIMGMFDEKAHDQ